MANYDIPQFPMKRLRYFNNQFLNEQDFIDDQAFHIGHERAQLRALCVAGVCEGLAVAFVSGAALSVAKGTAVDSYGRMIVLDAAANGPGPAALADGDYFLHISYLEAPTDMAPPAAGGAQDNTRWHSEPTIAATAKGGALPDGAVVLGTFKAAAGAFVAGSTSSVGRQYSGLRLPGPDATKAATLTNRNDGSSDGAILNGALTVRRDTGATLGPVLTLTNGNAYPGTGASAALEFNPYDPGTTAPALRIQSISDNNGSSHLAVLTKAPGAATNTLVERLRVTSGGLLQFTNEVKDKLVAYEASAVDRYGMGLAAGNLSLFVPPGGHLSLRQSSSTGAEVFSVAGTGAVTLSGPLVPKVGNDASSGIQFPVNPGGGGGDEAFLRYSVVAGETTKLILGINNDPDDALVLWQGGAAKLTIANALVDIDSDIAMNGKNAFRAYDSWLRLNDTKQFTSGVYTPGLLRVDGDIQLTGGKIALTGSDPWLRLNNSGHFSAGVYTPGVLRADGDLQLQGKSALRGNDSWLRLNQDGQFGSGVYTPGVLRADGDLQLQGKTALRGNDTWLRLNQDGHFGNGVYTPGVLRADGEVQFNQHVTVAQQIGVMGNSPTGGGQFPGGWGGGVHTWDLVAEASVGYGALTKWSSIDKKQGIREVPDALATLHQLNPAIYEKEGQSHAGFVAEEVREVFGHGAEADPERFFAVGIHPDALLTLTIAAVQELSAQVQELQAAARNAQAVAAGGGEHAHEAPHGAPAYEILREGSKDSQQYVTARFRAQHHVRGLSQVVRTLRIPEGAQRDECLAAELAAWHRRLVG